MKKILGTVFTTGALLFTVNSAKALQVSDINQADSFFGPGPLLLDSYTGTFTLPAPFNPADWNVTSAYAEFVFGDAAGRESFTLTLEGGEFVNQVDLPNWSILTIDFNPLTSNTLDELQDGSLSYTVTRTSGGFSLIEARLFAEIEPVSTQNVPEGGATIALLGLGMAALVGMRRKAALK